MSIRTPQDSIPQAVPSKTGHKISVEAYFLGGGFGHMPEESQAARTTPQEPAHITRGMTKQQLVPAECRLNDCFWFEKAVDSQSQLACVGDNAKGTVWPAFVGGAVCVFSSFALLGLFFALGDVL